MGGGLDEGEDLICLILLGFRHYLLLRLVLNSERVVDGGLSGPKVWAIEKNRHTLFLSHDKNVTKVYYRLLLCW